MIKSFFIFLAGFLIGAIALYLLAIQFVDKIAPVFGN
jgi:hypothetical protein